MKINLVSRNKVTEMKTRTTETYTSIENNGKREKERKGKMDDKENPRSPWNKNWHYEDSQVFLTFGELDKVYASSDHTDFTAIACYNKVPPQRVLERMSSHLEVWNAIIKTWMKIHYFDIPLRYPWDSKD